MALRDRSLRLRSARVEASHRPRGQLCVAALHEGVVRLVIPFAKLGQAVEDLLRVTGSIALLDLTFERAAGSAELLGQAFGLMAGSHDPQKPAKAEPGG